MQSDDILINEIQLGNQLGQAVHRNQRGDFALMLSMMSQNVLDQAAFALPSDSPGADDMDEERLRQVLGLAAKPVFAAGEESAMDAILLGVDLHTEGLTEVKLKGYLNPEPLALVDDVMHIESQVLGNCEQTVMQRHFMKDVKIAEKLEHNEAGLYEVLEDLHAAA